ncbi:hypothetical protein J2848_001376 [Azospirillum lipoferum]|uniref:DUF3574 domain-containing protein n=1 Tax=Azospirillum lipoferum TaxID=193 RepID=A0A5A9GUX0_AZOLI|nr:MULTISPECIES: DUF3574 domain-containing protein [Azospirillum]KAA0598288.1 DUF3574 domain-containing protein [Azospirillum lipoferum]MCP1609729.1 hypothetical protein [Azospirillum lipoferum]MDW5534966.1 DUF3574 domain-containing protein [Azospirillum sp. NL1]
MRPITMPVMRIVPSLSSAALSLLLLINPVAAQLAPAPVVAPLACAAYAAGPMIEAQLFFGRNIGDALGVSEGDWADFLNAEVTPRFPNGLTVTDGSGHWRDMETGRLVREPSKILTLLADGDPATLRLIREIVDLYKGRFHQQSVALVIRPACVSF